MTTQSVSVKIAWAVAVFMALSALLLMGWGMFAQQRAWALEWEVKQLRQDVDRVDEYWNIETRRIWIAIRTQHCPPEDDTPLPTPSQQETPPDAE